MPVTREASAVSRALPSATVVLVRDTGNGPELLLVLRHAKTSFGATYVFPGGLLGPDDDKVAERCLGVDDAGANSMLGLETGGLAYYSAAIRESFEEAGVLLARTSTGEWADAGPLAHYRDPLNDGRESWLGFLQKYDLYLACDALHYFSFWITPRELPKRFSTRFFAAALPAGQIATHCGTELTDSRWLSARAALADHEQGRFELPHPTVVTLQSLSRFDAARDMLQWACERGRAGVECLLPAVVMVGEERRVLMPGDAAYPHDRNDR